MAVQITTHDGPAAARLADPIVRLYGKVWQERVAQNEFYRQDLFAERYEQYVKKLGFCVSLARDGDEAVGMMFGATLPADTTWWKAFVGDVDADFIREDGHRTFGINELAVITEHRRKGLASRLHQALIGRRSEERAVLLVRPDNEAARSAYTGWGWREIGTLQPAETMPNYIVMVRDLPL